MLKIILAFLVGMMVVLLLVLRRKPDVAFRRDVSRLLIVCSDYFSSIFELLFQESNAEKNAENKKYILEKIIIKYSPVWVYEYGYNIELQQGHRHFLIMVERVEQTLFSLHHIARHSFDKFFLQSFQDYL